MVPVNVGVLLIVGSLGGAADAIDMVAGSYRNRYEDVLVLVSLIRACSEFLVALLVLRAVIRRHGARADLPRCEA